MVHYDLPRDTEAFLHRSGRTGRAGKTGSTIAVVLPRDRSYFRRMCGEIKLRDVEYISPPSPAAVMEASAKQVRAHAATCLILPHDVERPAIQGIQGHL